MDTQRRTPKRNLRFTALLSLALITGSVSLTVSLAKTAGVDMSAIRTVVKSHMFEVQKCYSDLLIEGMAAKGKVMVTWDVDGKGAAQNVEVKNPKPEMQAVTGCVTEKVSGWAFPAASGEKPYPVSYSFNFGS